MLLLHVLRGVFKATITGGSGAADLTCVRLATTCTPGQVLRHMHNQRSKTAGVSLDTTDLAKVPDGAETWENVIRKVKGGMMPPVGMPRPEKAELDALASYLETTIDRAAAAKPNPGRTVLHRLNRAEYGNAIRDLFALDLD